MTQIKARAARGSTFPRVGIWRRRAAPPPGAQQMSRPAVIRKDLATPAVEPNLSDYAAERAAFSWQAARRAHRAALARRERRGARFQLSATGAGVAPLSRACCEGST
ncbi:MAG: hypothetical protein M0015_17300 [Betaproteobacteria bacterium]|nr:hypothetical protein [Betaproteobacteria bacterium]